MANQKPTVNVNDIIDGYNESEQTNIQRVSVEWMAARICSEMEILTGLYFKQYILCSEPVKIRDELKSINIFSNFLFL